MQTQEICCRGYDSSQNSQPNSFTWNLMGMMNNCIYRVKVGRMPMPLGSLLPCPSDGKLALHRQRAAVTQQ